MNWLTFILMSYFLFMPSSSAATTGIGCAVASSRVYMRTAASPNPSAADSAPIMFTTAATATYVIYPAAKLPNS